MRESCQQRTICKEEIIGLNFENKIAVNNHQIDKFDYQTLLWLKNSKRDEARRIIHNGSSLKLSIILKTFNSYKW
jgi:hypothetical protein